MVDNLVERWQHLQENLLKREPGLLKRVLLALQKCWKTRVGRFFFEALKFNMLYRCLSIWFILTLLTSDLSYFCNWWKSLPGFRKAKGFEVGLYFTFFVCWLQQIKILAAMLFCLQGLLARLSQHEFHLGRDWPLEIGGRFFCAVRGSRARKKLFPRNVTKTTSTAENTKEYPKWKLLLPTSNRHLQGFFWIFNLPGVFYFGKWRWFSSSKLYEVWAKKLVFYFGDLFWGFCKDGKGTWPISPCHPSKYTQSVFQIGQYILQNSHSKMFRYDTCHRRTLLQHDFLSIFISVFRSKLHKKKANHPDPPMEPTKITSPLPHPIFFGLEAKPRGPSPLF